MNAPVLNMKPRAHHALGLLVREEVSSYGPVDGSGEPPRSTPPLEPEAVSDWALAHARIVALGKERAGHEREVCRWLSCAERLGVHRRAGYASLREYAERLLGLRGRQTEERLRVGRALAELPALDGALAAGLLSWSAVRELSRIATAATQVAWIEWAKGRPARAVEKAVASRLPGDGPRDAGDASRIPHRLSFAVSPETIALFRDLQARVRSDLGGHVDDDTLLFELARRALRSGSGGGPQDEDRASYQVAVSRCDVCGRTSIDAGGESEVVDPAVAEMFDCDHQHVGRVDGAEVKNPHVGAKHTKALPGQCHPRESGEPEVTLSNWIPASAGMTSRNGGQSSTPAEKRRATQTIPPAVRRQVIRRDHRRCIVPGCANHQFLDVHHLDKRSEGGGHDPQRLATLCGGHHRAVHQGRLWIDGSGSAGFVVRHAGGEACGAPPSPPAIDAVAKAQSGLEHMGFTSSRARGLIEAALHAGAPHDAAALLHEALRLS